MASLLVFWLRFVELYSNNRSLFRPNACRRGEPFSLSLTWKKKVGTKDAGSSLDLPLPSYQIQSEVSFSIHLFNKNSTLVTLVPFQLNNHKIGKARSS